MEFTTVLNHSNPNPMIHGGKGSNIIKLRKLGFNVPDGFIVNKKAFNYFFEENGLKSFLSAIKTLTPKEILSFSKKVSPIIIHSILPQDLIRDIKKTFGHLEEYNNTRNNNNFYAVRSSATVEDAENFSFAGQASSFLFNKGFDEVLNSIVKCWASLFSPQSLLYLLKMRKLGVQITPEELGMAVVVQKMVDSKISGVLFTVNILNNNETQIFINSAWGLCEVVANNICQPDTVIVNKNTLKIEDYTIGKKERKCINNPNNKGTKVIETSLELRQTPSLSRKKVKELSEIALNIEREFKKPQDIEWTIDRNGKLYILQTRPITTLKK